MPDEVTISSRVELATELTIAWLGNPNTRATIDDVPAFLHAIYESVRGLYAAAESNAGQEAAEEYTPATTVRRSLSSADHIISMINGKPYKTLGRHLSAHGMNPEQYRERYKLKSDYPMVAPSYSEIRRSMAKKFGLGQKRKVAPAPELRDPAADKPTARRGRKSKAATLE